MQHVIELPHDHPGFGDAKYRARRDAIARHRSDDGISYSEEEHALWRDLSSQLVRLHARHACRAIRRAAEVVGLRCDRIPQLSEVNAKLVEHTGFRMEPVAGLVPSREFFAALARRVFLSTRYIRHASRPHFTPEPDIVHELWGHAASLAHPEIAELNVRIGAASLDASDATIAVLERVYWFSLEFGLVLEDGEPKALGAGLLSSVAEMQRAVPLRPLTYRAMAETRFRTDAMQDALFVASSFDELVGVSSGQSGKEWLAPMHTD